MISEIIYNWLRSLFSVPKVFGDITYSQTYNLLKPHAKNLYLSDLSYSLTSKEEFSKFLEIDRTNFKKWKAETHDCDNFSYQLMGYFSKWNYSFCFGIAFSESHAFNIFVDEKRNIYVIEPQSDQIFSLDEIKGNKLYYPFELVLI